MALLLRSAVASGNGCEGCDAEVHEPSHSLSITLTRTLSCTLCGANVLWCVCSASGDSVLVATDEGMAELTYLAMTLADKAEM